MQEMTHRLSVELKRLSFENHDSCVKCSYIFQEGDTTHLGYDESDFPIYVCDECSYLLRETAVRHRFSPRSYLIPEGSSKLWRYMDFTKYVSLLASRSLYFARADTFSDEFEGAKGLRKNKEKWDQHYLDFFKYAIKNPPEEYDFTLSENEIDEQAIRLVSDLEKSGRAQKKWTFVSCWHENKHESEAMWRLYSSYLDNALAIRTSYDSLYKSLGRDPSIDIGKVNYIDYENGYAGVNSAFWSKRKSFEHEKEVRAIIREFETEELGKSIPCDLSILIEEIYVSPTAPSWFMSLINDVNEKYDINISVSKSTLTEEPFF